MDDWGPGWEWVDRYLTILFLISVLVERRTMCDGDVFSRFTIGMMMELGPCRINNGGNGTHHNLYSWTHNSSMIFIDQPAGTGLSYVDPGIPLPGDSFVSAEDMYIFLQIFLTQVFPKKRLVPFHIAGESYGVRPGRSPLDIASRKLIKTSIGPLCPDIGRRDPPPERTTSQPA